MYEAQPTKSPTAGAQSTPVGKFSACSISDHDVLDRALAINEHTDLATNLSGEFRHRSSEVVRNESVCRQFASTESLKCFDGVGFQATCVSVNLDEVLLTIREAVRGPSV